MGSPPSTAEIQQQQQHQHHHQNRSKEAEKSRLDIYESQLESSKEAEKSQLDIYESQLESSKEAEKGLWVFNGTANRKQQMHQEQKHDVHKLQGSADISAKSDIVF